MDNDQIVSRMNSYLHTSANVLADWLGSLLPRASDDWWEECVLDKLSYNQREMAIERGFTELGQFDLAALLRIADKSWYAMRNVAFLPTMLMYGKEASNRKQEIDRQHYTIPNQRPKDKHCGKI
ncbi:hypothetical protein [Agathobacter ruminis]|jgi:hypothetical protein|uniref:Uncharacterized protein n=1 Tax=Agathobacter ruminis TaxID=1712665 RepID=A0A2G3E219_9FIRM|nr:hypothetical protein [Agathobacter ruminis]MDC7301216.1 hypothetical protein [Agathobacter ruminis]PHU37326.1 hypothetical protein CSX02_08315 [Agathobacter ruminis]